ncbi:MAG: hypothetical protein ACXWU6_12295, partial [Allosphingosinicella sp.]
YELRQQLKGREADLNAAKEEEAIAAKTAREAQNRYDAVSDEVLRLKEALAAPRLEGLRAEVSECLKAMRELREAGVDPKSLAADLLTGQMPYGYSTAVT